MKAKLFSLVLSMVIAASVSAQSDYKNSIGIRLGNGYYDVIGASFKTFISQPGALEFNLGVRPYSIGVNWFNASLSAAYQHHFPIANIDGFKWYVGGGAVLANTFSDHEGYKGFSAGLFPTGGVDYKLQNAPFAFSVDARPTVHVIRGNEYGGYRGFYFNGGVTARYVF